MQHLDQNDLAKRWRISPRTLEQWRWQGRGPRYLKIGGRVRYQLPDVETFESNSLHANTSVAATPFSKLANTGTGPIAGIASSIKRKP
jgi:hypothetical protein